MIAVAGVVVVAAADDDVAVDDACSSLGVPPDGEVTVWPVRPSRPS